MNSKSQKKIIIIGDNKNPDWKICLKKELNRIQSNNIEIDCKNLDLYCKDILEIIAITNEHNCRNVSFCSMSAKTIVSCKSLGYESHYILQNHSTNSLNLNHKDSDLSKKTNFHQGTLRSGEYLESPGDLLILGDVNPGAIVSAEGNIIIWGRLLGIAHAGSKGDFKATISALQLRPVQLRIANKVARGPKEKNQLGFAEQASIDCEQIIISPMESI